MARSKRHHWWPVCHSKHWVDEEGCITKIDAAGVCVRTTPSNIAVIGHYNSIVRADGTRDCALETFFADEIEHFAAPIIARLAQELDRDMELERHYDYELLARQAKQIRSDGFVPRTEAYSIRCSPKERGALSRYIASLMVRVPSYKDTLNSAHIRENLADVLGLSAEAARQEADLLHVDVVRRHLEDYATRLSGCTFMLLDAPDGSEFLMGDTPVIPAALGFGEAEAMCPITPTRALLMLKGYKAPFADRISAFLARSPTVRVYNRTMVQNADREIFCRRSISVSFVTKHLGSRKIRLVPRISTLENGGTAGPMLDRSKAAR